jgi:hypothetical protein
VYKVYKDVKAYKAYRDYKAYKAYKVYRVYRVFKELDLSGRVIGGQMLHITPMIWSHMLVVHM